MNHFKIATNQKRLYFDVHLTARSLPLLYLLYDLNIVRRYIKLTGSFYRVYPAYSIYRNRTRFIKTYFKSSHYLTIPLFILHKVRLSRPFSYLVLETSAGILTHKEAIRYKLGGRLIMTIN